MTFYHENVIILHTYANGSIGYSVNGLGIRVNNFSFLFSNVNWISIKLFMATNESSY